MNAEQAILRMVYTLSEWMDDKRRRYWGDEENGSKKWHTEYRKIELSLWFWWESFLSLQIQSFILYDFCICVVHVVVSSYDYPITIDCW